MATFEHHVITSKWQHWQRSLRDCQIFDVAQKLRHFAVQITVVTRIDRMFHQFQLDQLERLLTLRSIEKGQQQFDHLQIL